MPIAVREGSVNYFVRVYHIGRPVFATNAAGAKVWSLAYLPFGGVRASTGVPTTLRFPGQWFQSENGLHQNWMRDYDPTLGRYLQADPLGLVDGASVYGYAGQSPGRYTDPTGTNAGVVAGPLAELLCSTNPVCAGAVIVLACGIGAYEVYEWWNAPPFILHSEAGDKSDKPPPGSKGIDETPWSGDHGKIKGQVGAGPDDDVKISPDGEVWVQDPDGSWTNYGPASDYTGSGKPGGRRGKDRDGW